MIVLQGLLIIYFRNRRSAHEYLLRNLKESCKSITLFKVSTKYYHKKYHKKS